MPKIRAHNVQAHRTLLRGQLLDAFEELLLEHSYEDVSIAAVAAKAGVARNTVYNYAKDKADLLAGAARRRMERLGGPAAALAAQLPEPALRLERLLSLMMGLVLTDPMSPRVFQELMTHGNQADVEHAVEGTGEILPVVLRTLHDGQASGAFLLAGSDDFTIDLIGSVMMTTAERILASPIEAQPTIDAAIGFVMRALRAE